MENILQSHFPKIVTAYVYPPIPTRIFDWMAWVDGENGEEDSIYGYGPTEQDAIKSLEEKIDICRSAKIATSLSQIASDAQLESRE